MKKLSRQLLRWKTRFSVCLSFLVSFYCLFVHRLAEDTSHREDFMLRKLIFFLPMLLQSFYLFIVYGASMDINEHL